MRVSDSRRIGLCSVGTHVQLYIVCGVIAFPLAFANVAAIGGGKAPGNDSQSSIGGLSVWVRYVASRTSVRLGVEVAISDHEKTINLRMPKVDAKSDVTGVIYILEEMPEALLAVREHDESSVTVLTTGIADIERNPLDHKVQQFKFTGTMGEFMQRLRELFPEVGPTFEQPPDLFEEKAVTISFDDPVTIRSILSKYSEAAGVSWYATVGEKLQKASFVDTRTDEPIIETFESRTTIYFYPSGKQSHPPPNSKPAPKDSDHVASTS